MSRKRTYTQSKLARYLFGILSLYGFSMVRGQEMSLLQSTLTMSPTTYIYEGETYSFTLQAKDADGNDLTSGGEQLRLVAEQRCTYDPVTDQCTRVPDQSPVADLPKFVTMTDNEDGTYSASMQFLYDSLITFSVRKPGLEAQYFYDDAWNGDPDFVQVDDSINFGFGGPRFPLNTIWYISATWEGYLYVPEETTYNLQIYHDETCDLTIGSFHQRWGGFATRKKSVDLQAGYQYFYLKWQQTHGGLVMKLYWDHNRDPGSYTPIPADNYFLEPGIAGNSVIDGAVYPKEFCRQEVLQVKTNGLTDKTGIEFTFEAKLRDITETMVGTLARGVVLKAVLLNWDNYRSPIGVDYDWPLHYKTENLGYNRKEGPDWVSTQFNIEWAGYYSILVETEGVQCTYTDLFVDFKPSETLDVTKLGFSEFPETIDNGRSTAFRIQARDSNNNNIKITLQELGVKMSVWLESEDAVVEGEVLDYLNDDLGAFDPSSPTLGTDGTPFPGVFLAKISAPEGTPPGEYAIFLQLGEDILVPTPRPTVQVRSLCKLSDQFYKSQEIMISNNAGRYPTSASYAQDIRLALQALGEHEGALEACGALTPILNSPYKFLALDEDAQTLSVVGTDTLDEKILAKYATGTYEDAEIIVGTENYETLFFTIRVKIFWDGLPSAESDIEPSEASSISEDSTEENLEQDIDGDEELLLQQISSILSSKSESEITEMLGDALGIQDPAAALSNTTGSLEIDDNTDLEKEAKFDIQAFLAERGLLKKALPKSQAGLGPPPAFVLENNLRDVYALPFANKGFSQDGKVVLDFPKKVKRQEFDKLFRAFSSEKNSESEEAQRRLRDAPSTATFKNDGNGGTTLQTGESLLQTQQLIKLTQSVNCTLVPGDEVDLDKKNFTWKLEIYNSDKVGFKFQFEHPEYISVSKPDTMKIQISNTEKLFEPEDADVLPMPDGYIIMQKIPPQGVGLLSAEEVETAKGNGQAFVFVNLVISIVLQGTLQLLLGSIIVVQILSHFPLADISLPANVFQQFDLMIQFVSFDLFSPTDYINFGFSETPAWSERFDWVGYGSVNFFENMGSILIFGFQTTIFLLISFIVQPLKRRFCGSNFLDRLKIGLQVENAVLFFHGTLFEILLCVLTSFCTLHYYPWLIRPDHVSIFVAGFFALCLAAYLIFLVFFSLTKASKISKLQQATHEKNLTEFESKVHRKLIDKRVKRSGTEQGWETEKYLARFSKDREKRIQSGDTIKIPNLEFYKVLLDGLKHNSTIALFNDVFIQVRRISLLLMAMFVVEQQWLQVIVFTQMTFFFLCLYFIVRPYDSGRMNNVAVLNEFIILFLSYGIAQNQDMQYSMKDRIVIGKFIFYSIYILWACNAIILAYFSIKEVKAKLLAYLQKRRVAKMNQARAQESQLAEAAQSPINDSDLPKNLGQLEPISEVNEDESDIVDSPRDGHGIEATVKKPASAQGKIPLKTRAGASSKQNDDDIMKQIDDIFGEYEAATATDRRQSSGNLYEPQSKLLTGRMSSRLCSPDQRRSTGLGVHGTEPPMTRITTSKPANQKDERSSSSDDSLPDKDREFIKSIEKAFESICNKEDKTVKRDQRPKKEEPQIERFMPSNRVKTDTRRAPQAASSLSSMVAPSPRLPNYSNLLRRRNRD